MSKPLRLIIAMIVGLFSLAFFIMVYLALFENQEISSTLGAGTAVAVMFFTYRNIKPTEKDAREDNTKVVENFHPNGMTSERGELVFGKKDGSWNFFNEQGELIREDIYKNGEWVESIQHKR